MSKQEFVTFSGNDNRYPKFDGDFKVYECDDRGARFLLGPNPKDPNRSLKIVFSELNVSPILGRIRMHKANGDPIEEGYEAVRLLEASDVFDKGKVRYVPSPDELRAKRKSEEQAKQLEIYREQLAEGVFALNPDMDLGAATKLADLIGAEYEGLQKGVILKNIRDLLKADKPVVLEKPSFVVEPAAVVETPVIEKRGPGRRRKLPANKN